MTTSYRTIANSDGSIELFDIVDSKGDTYIKQPALSFPKSEWDNLWDNSEYLKKFFEGLKSGEKNAKTELKDFCQKNKLDYKRVKKELIAIYKQSKKEKFWK